jgi:6-phosphofructokinase 1
MMAEIYHDTSVYHKGRVTIVEIMGRDAGWLTAATHLANIYENGPDLIYLPESPFDMNKFLQDVKALYESEIRKITLVNTPVASNKETIEEISNIFKVYY